MKLNKRKLIVLFLISFLVVSIVSVSVIYNPDENGGVFTSDVDTYNEQSITGSSYENQYGKLEVYPDVSTGICRQTQYANLNWYAVDSVIDVVFRFDEQIGDTGIWIWDNISHDVRVPDYGWKQDNYTLVNISSWELLQDEPEYVNFGDIPSIYYGTGTVSYWDEDSIEWFNGSFIVGFDSFDWLNPEHTNAMFHYEHWGVTGYHWEEQFWFDWRDIISQFSYSYGYGTHNYYVTDWNVQQRNYSFKWQYGVPANSNGKWILMAKLSSETILEALSSGHYIELDPWWDSDWSYYKTVKVDDKIDDYQMFINVSYSSFGDVSCESHSQTDFDDLRFVYDNTTELPYWFETVVDNDYVHVWVNNSGNYSFFEMFYGNLNDAVGNNSDGNATFDFFDDFSYGSVPDASKWTVTDDAPAVSGGNLVCDNDDEVKSNINLVFGFGYEVVARSKCDEDDAVFLSWYYNDNKEHGTMVRSDNTDYGTGAEHWNNVGIYTNDNGLTIHTGDDTWDSVLSFQIYRIVKVSENITLFYQNDNTDVITTTIPSEDSWVLFRAYDSSQESSLFVDWTFVKKYNYPEPSYSFDSEKSDWNYSQPLAWKIINETGVTILKLSVSGNLAIAGLLWENTNSPPGGANIVYNMNNSFWLDMNGTLYIKETFFEES